MQSQCPCIVYGACHLVTATFVQWQIWPVTDTWGVARRVATLGSSFSAFPQSLDIILVYVTMYLIDVLPCGRFMPIPAREQCGYTHGYPEANPHPYPPWVSTHPCGYDK